MHSTSVVGELCHWQAVGDTKSTSLNLSRQRCIQLHQSSTIARKKLRLYPCRDKIVCESLYLLHWWGNRCWNSGCWQFGSSLVFFTLLNTVPGECLSAAIQMLSVLMVRWLWHWQVPPDKWQVHKSKKLQNLQIWSYSGKHKNRV